MSTPNDPDTEGASGRPETASTSGPGSGTPTAGLVPPWQRGPAEVRSDPDATTTARMPAADQGPGSPPGPHQRGAVQNSHTAAASMSGQQAPVTKLDNPPRGRSATATQEKFVESPTSTIERDQLASSQLPDLDEIHHADVKRAAENAAASKPATKSAPRSAPEQVQPRSLRAAIQIRRIDPWATFKIAAVLSVIGFFIWMIAIAVLFLVLDGMGVWDQVNNSFGTLVTADGSTSEGDIIGAGTVFGGAALLGAVNAILLTALATIGSYIYNICADLVGGAEVTLADLD